MEKKIQVVPIILAGGSGTRLWPLSRSDFPKQFLVISENKTLFQQSVERLNSFDKNIEYIQGLKSKILDKRLMAMMESATSHRVHEDLGRLFSRRLKELREQQSWRLKRDIIDVLSEEE